MTNRILVLKGKQGDSYYDASTPEALAGAALAALSANSYYYSRPEAPRIYPPVSEEDTELLKLTDEELDSLPKAIRNPTKAHVNGIRSRISRAKREFEERVVFYDSVKALLDLPFEEAMKKTVFVGQSRTREVPLALDLLDQRADYEYESYEIIDLYDAEKGFHPIKN